jgi:chemotaxis signal transduction protein
VSVVIATRASPVNMHRRSRSQKNRGASVSVKNIAASKNIAAEAGIGFARHPPRALSQSPRLPSPSQVFVAKPNLRTGCRYRHSVAPPEDVPLSETTAYLLLDVAGTPCALARSALSEVLPLPRLHQPPAGGGLLAGFLNLGGVPVPVVDLARLLGLRGPAEPTGGDPYRHLVLSADRAMAFLVDRADDLMRVADASVRPVPEDRTLNGCRWCAATRSSESYPAPICCRRWRG